MNVTEAKRLLPEGEAAMHALRRALARTLDSVAADASQSQEISRRFGIDKTLAWRITRVVKEEDAWEALGHLPTRAGIEIFVEAMERAGTPAPQLEALRHAYDAFERFVRTHAGDRHTLDMMVSVPDRRSSEKKLEAYRKAGFQCNASLLGVRAAAQFGLNLMAPSRDRPGMLDVALIGGVLELFRLRPIGSWSVATVRNWGGARGDLVDGPGGALPISEEQPPTPLVREFCSPPTLQLRSEEESDRTYRYYLESGPVGYAATANIVTGRVMLATAPARASHPGETGEHGVNITTPAEELVVDLLVHRDLHFAMDVTAHVYSQFPGGAQYPDPRAESLKLPVPTRVLDLGPLVVGPPDPPTPAAAWYPLLLQRVAARMGRELGEFHAFRYRLKYPPVPSIAILRHPLMAP